jgi:hypothetical protein
MKTYSFSVILKGIHCLNDEIPERLYEAGCDDSSPYSGGGVTGAAFDREAISLEVAITSAISAVRQAGYEIERVEIDSDDAVRLEATS